MSRTTIFLTILISLSICMLFGVANNAISFGMIVGGASALFAHWLWNGGGDQ